MESATYIILAWLAANGLLDLGRCGLFDDRRGGAKRKRVNRANSFVAAMAMLLAVPVLAVDEHNVRVEKEDRSYRIHAAFDVPASIDQIKSVLTDFANPSRLTSAVTAREILGQQDGAVRVRTELRDCVLFFCKSLALIQDVTVSADEVRADVVPGGSDFRHGFLRWSINDVGNGSSHVIFDAVMEPDFFVPPVIGGLLVRKAVRKQVLATMEKLVSEAPREPATPEEKP